MAKKKKKTKLKQLAEAAEELNQVLGLEPPIETEGASVNELAGKIREASELLYEEDEITDPTAEVIADLTEDLDEPDEQEEAEEETESEESEEDEEELTLEDLREEVEGLHKRKDMRLLVEEIDLFEPLIEKLPDLKSGSALKGAMLKLLDEAGAEGAEDPEDPEEVDDGQTVGTEVEEEPEAKEKKGKGKAKKAEKKPAKKKSLTQQCRDLLEDFFEEGGHTRDELVALVKEELPELKDSSIQVVITDSKNPKYNKLSKLVVEAEDGTLSFK